MKMLEYGSWFGASAKPSAEDKQLHDAVKALETIAANQSRTQRIIIEDSGVQRPARMPAKSLENR